MSQGAVSGTRRTAKQLVDGTWRVTIDIEPRFGRDFLELLGEVDMPVALAPLIPGFESATAGAGEPAGDGFDETQFKADDIGQIATFSINEEEAKHIGGSSWTTLGPLCQSAIECGKNEAFQKWVLSRVGEGQRGKEASVEVVAANYIRDRCRVTSRKDLDTDADAKTRFGAMMADYRKWLSAAH